MSDRRCKACRKVLVRRTGESDKRWDDRQTCSHVCGGKWGRRKREDHVALQPHRCALDGCDVWVPRLDGEHDSDYRRRRYCSDGHRAAGRSAVLSAKAPEMPLCECGCGRRVARRAGRCASKSCAMVVRGRGPRETKVCECGCGTRFERPKGIAGAEWERRRFLDVEHRTRAGWLRPGEAREGEREEPKPVASKDRRKAEDPPEPAEPKPKPKPEPEPRKVFDGPPPVEPFRPGRIPVVERAPRPTRRPSFGLTRRSA